jgi:hypothetical protein
VAIGVINRLRVYRKHVYQRGFEGVVDDYYAQEVRLTLGNFYTPPLTSCGPLYFLLPFKNKTYEAPFLSELLLGETPPKSRASSTEELVREPVAQ